MRQTREHAPPSPTVVRAGGRDVSLTCHMAALSGNLRRNSLAAIEECFAANATRMEVDVHTLDGDDSIIYHERRLEHQTDGDGTVGRATPAMIRGLHYLDDAHARPPLVSEVVELARGCDTEVQLDLKDWRPMPPERLRALIAPITAIRDRVIVSTGQDWNLRRLHDEAPDIAIGFDPGHYIDHRSEETDFFLPRTMGAYGYRDDHPLAIGRTESVEDYLRERMTILHGQVPFAREWFLSYRVMLQMLDDGFDPIAFLHDREIEVTAWTLDQRNDATTHAFERLAAAGIDHVTTNTIPAWRATFA